jgi:hypothetical protein
MNRLIALLLIVCCPAFGQSFSVKTPSPRLVSPSPDNTMPPGKFYVNLATIPKPRFGFSYDRLKVVGDERSVAPSSPDMGGQFRIICGTSHWSFDDPIVKPRQSGVTHLHTFFGNTSTDAQSDASNMANVGRSTCHGGTVNRTGYWTPTPIYHRPGHARDGEVIPAIYNNAYYKTEGLDNAHVTALEWFPPGFRMIGGDPTATGPLTDLIGRFDCIGPTTTTIYPRYSFDHIPTTAEIQNPLLKRQPGEDNYNANDTTQVCNDFNMLVRMPNCWNGVDLYVPSAPGTPYTAHTRYRSNGGGCLEAGFTHSFPNVTFNIHFHIPVADFDYIFLSSDPPTAGPTTRGRTLHGDWANGWKQVGNYSNWGMTFVQALMKGCYDLVPPVGQIDCHDDNIGSPLNDGNFYQLY